MNNLGHTEPTPSAADLLIAELREQARFLREELTRTRAEAEAMRQNMDEQLAAKDAQIERLLRLLESPSATRTAVVSLAAEEEEELEIPLETGPNGEESPPVSPLPPAPIAALRRGFKTHADICPYLRARYDQASAHTYPTKNNGCWSPRIHKARRQEYGVIDNPHQDQYCLHEGYLQCVHFDPAPAETAAVPSEEESRKHWWSRKG